MLNINRSQSNNGKKEEDEFAQRKRTLKKYFQINRDIRRAYQDNINKWLFLYNTENGQKRLRPSATISTYNLEYFIRFYVTAILWELEQVSFTAPWT